MATTQVLQSLPSHDENKSGVVQVLRSGQSFGWLRKKSKFGVSRYNLRFFTVDFDARILFYSSSEFGKKVSMPIPFCDILAVEAGTEAEEDGQKRPQRKCWKSCLPRISKAEEHHDFVLYTKGRHMELRCSSVVGRQKWVATFQAAILHQSEDPTKAFNEEELGSEQSTRASSREPSDSCMTNESEQASEGSEGATEQSEVEVPQSSMAEPCRNSTTEHLSPSLQWAVGSTPKMPQLPQRNNLLDDCDDDWNPQPVGSPFCPEVTDCSPPCVVAPSGTHQPCLRNSAAAADQTKEDLQALLIDAVCSSSSSAANVWKRPAQPTIERPAQPKKDSPCATPDVGMLPPIQEESTPRADEDEADESPCPPANPTFRERLLAHGMGPLPPDIEIP